MIEIYKKVLTQKGMELHAKNLAGETITFTKFQFGSGTYTGEETESYLESMVALKTVKGTFGISKVERVSKDNQATCKLTLAATNVDITTGYYITEIGEFAKGVDGTEILYSIAVAEPDKPEWMPAYNGKAAVSVKYIDYISVGNASNVTLSVGAGGVALQEDLEALEDRVLDLERGSAACIGIRRKCQEDNTPQSDTAWERWGQYTDAVVNYARGDDAVQNDLMSKWPYNLLRPCNLPLDADEPVAYLGNADFDWYGAEGTAAGTSVMLEVPTEMYLAHWYETDSSGQNWEYKCVADSPRYPGSVYVKDLMARSDGTQTDHFYFPIFLGSLDADGHYISVAGVAPKYNYTCTAARTAVKTNGDNWQLIDVWAWEVISDLGEIMSADANFKTTYGQGCCNFGSAFNMKALTTETGTNTVVISSTYESYLRVGMTVNISNTGSWNASVAQDRQITAIADSASTDDAIEVTLDGDAFDIAEGNVLWRGAQKTGATVSMASPNGTAGANDGLHSVRMFWIEDMWAMLHTGVDGMNLKFNETDMCLDIYVCEDPSKYADSYTDYTKLAETMPLNGDNSSNYELSGYIKRMLHDEDYPLLEMPEVVGNNAGSATYLAAYAWKNKNGQRPFFGGTFYYGAFVSPRSRSCGGGFSSSPWYCGSRPLKR